jgi:hypothetical protein
MSDRLSTITGADSNSHAHSQNSSPSHAKAISTSTPKYCKPSIEEDMFALLTNGLPSKSVHKFLSTCWTSQNLSRLQKVVEKTCAEMIEVVQQNIMPAVEQLLFRLCELRSIARWKDRYSCLGLDEAIITSAIHTASAFALKSEDLLQVIIQSNKNYHCLFKWMLAYVIKYTDDEMTQNTPESLAALVYLNPSLSMEVEAIAECLRLDLTCDRLGTFFVNDDSNISVLTKSGNTSTAASAFAFSAASSASGSQTLLNASNREASSSTTATTATTTITTTSVGSISSNALCQASFEQVNSTLSTSFVGLNVPGFSDLWKGIIPHETCSIKSSDNSQHSEQSDSAPSSSSSSSESNASSSSSSIQRHHLPMHSLSSLLHRFKDLWNHIVGLPKIAISNAVYGFNKSEHLHQDDNNKEKKEKEEGGTTNALIPVVLYTVPLFRLQSASTVVLAALIQSKQAIVCCRCVQDVNTRHTAVTSEHRANILSKDTSMPKSANSSSTSLSMMIDLSLWSEPGDIHNHFLFAVCHIDYPAITFLRIPVVSSSPLPVSDAELHAFMFAKLAAASNVTQSTSSSVFISTIAFQSFAPSIKSTSQIVSAQFYNDDTLAVLLTSTTSSANSLTTTSSHLQLVKCAFDLSSMTSKRDLNDTHIDAFTSENTDSVSDHEDNDVEISCLDWQPVTYHDLKLLFASNVNAAFNTTHVPLSSTDTMSKILSVSSSTVSTQSSISVSLSSPSTTNSDVDVTQAHITQLTKPQSFLLDIARTYGVDKATHIKQRSFPGVSAKSMCVCGSRGVSSVEVGCKGIIVLDMEEEEYDDDDVDDDDDNDNDHDVENVNVNDHDNEDN